MPAGGGSGSSDRRRVRYQQKVGNQIAEEKGQGYSEKNCVQVRGPALKAESAGQEMVEYDTNYQCSRRSIQSEPQAGGTAGVPSEQADQVQDRNHDDGDQNMRE